MLGKLSGVQTSVVSAGNGRASAKNLAPGSVRTEAMARNVARGASGPETVEANSQSADAAERVAATPPANAPVFPQNASRLPSAPSQGTSPQDAARGFTGIQPTGTAYGDDSSTLSPETGASPSGQAKPGPAASSAAGTISATPTDASQTGNPAGFAAINLLATRPPSIPPNHANSLGSAASSSDPQSPKTLSAWQNYDGGAGKIVRSASLTVSASGAEMHVELRSGALGPLEVHTVVREGSVGAEIHVQGQEAHTLLAAGLPSLERALGERNLRVENIAVYQDQAGGGMSGGTSKTRTRALPLRRSIKLCTVGQPAAPEATASSSSEDEESTNPAAGLSVQA